MVQLIFVHGVANRSGAGHNQEEANRNTLFEHILFAGTSVTIRSPRWGDLVPPIRGDAFAGAGGVAAFNALGGAGGGAGLGSAGGRQIAALGRTAPASALDAIQATIVDQADNEGRALTADELAGFREVADAMAGDPARFRAVSAAMAVAPPGDPVARADPEEPLESDTEEALIYAIRTAFPEGSYGIGGTVWNAVAALADRARNSVSTALSNVFRDSLNPLVGRFLGDVFVYLKEGEVREDIRALLRDEIVAAHEAAKESGEPLILIGHSLGGVILYDMLSSPGPAGLPGDLTVDAFLTVGSQPGLFEEMKLFQFRHEGGGPTPRPDCVRAWLNVFDPIDLLAFRTDPIFTRAEDFVFDSVTGLISSHTTYFKRPQFHARARERLRALGLIEGAAQ